MAIFLGILSVIVFFIGFYILGASETVIHEILAGILFIIWAIFLSAAAIVDVINSLKKQIAKEDVIIQSKDKNNQKP